MKLIPRDVDYAVRALQYIDSRMGRLVSAAEMTKIIGVAMPFLRKILQILQRGGILEAHKGKTGGFALAVPARCVSILDIMQVFHGELRLNECALHGKPCPRATNCKLRREVNQIEKQIILKLGSLNVKALAGRAFAKHVVKKHGYSPY